MQWLTPSGHPQIASVHTKVGMVPSNECICMCSLLSGRHQQVTHSLRQNTSSIAAHDPGEPHNFDRMSELNTEMKPASTHHKACDLLQL
eukprot:951791-Amphidinium_carterae.1